MKKYLLLLLSSGLLFMNTASAANDTIIPQTLTAKDTGNFNIMNNTAEKIFSEIIPRININTEHIYSIFDKSLVTLPQDKFKNPNYDYVQYKYAELVYANSNKELIEIRVEKLSNPKSYAVYDYPTGRLKYFQIYDDALMKYIKYTPYGSLYNPKVYMSNLSLRVTRQLNKVLGPKLTSPVKIYMDINKDGTLIDAKLQQSTGDKILDDEILNVVKQTAPFDEFSPKFPSHLKMILEFGRKK